VLVPAAPRKKCDNKFITSGRQAGLHTSGSVSASGTDMICEAQYSIFHGREFKGRVKIKWVRHVGTPLS
jgi:hypothetical protein